MAKQKQQPGNQPRIRNKEIRKVRVADLFDAPWQNINDHPDSQAAALDDAIDEIGFHGYPDVFEHDGKLYLYDGHLRKARLLAKYGESVEIEVNVTDFAPDEAKQAMLTKDPIARLAESNQEALDQLIAGAEFQSEALNELLADLSGDKGPTTLRQLSTMAPPKMSWVLVGIPTARFAEIAEQVEKISAVPEIVVETTVNDG